MDYKIAKLVNDFEEDSLQITNDDAPNGSVTEPVSDFVDLSPSWDLPEGQSSAQKISCTTTEESNDVYVYWDTDQGVKKMYYYLDPDDIVAKEVIEMGTNTDQQLHFIQGGTGLIIIGTAEIGDE